MPIEISGPAKAFLLFSGGIIIGTVSTYFQAITPDAEESVVSKLDKEARNTSAKVWEGEKS